MVVYGILWLWNENVNEKYFRWKIRPSNAIQTNAGTGTPIPHSNRTKAFDIKQTQCRSSDTQQYN